MPNDYLNALLGQPERAELQTRASTPGQFASQFGRVFHVFLMPRDVKGWAVWIGPPVAFLLVLALFAWSFTGIDLPHTFARIFAVILVIPVLYWLYSLYLRFRWMQEYYQKTQFKAHHGDLCPGVIVATAPYILATYTDMRQSEGDSWPCVKVIEEPFQRVPGRTYAVGERIATVSHYDGPYGKAHWEEFYATPIEFYNDSLSVNERQLRRLEAIQAWEPLEAFLKTLPRPVKSGLYWPRGKAQ